jgi:hypothetical protein
MCLNAEKKIESFNLDKRMYSISHTVDDTLQGHLKPRGKAVDAKRKSNGMFGATRYRITNLSIRSLRCLILV